MNDLSDLFSWSLEELSVAVCDHDHPFRNVVVSTASRTGVSSRILIMRRFDREDYSVEMHTDSSSSKVAELHMRPTAGLLVWSPDLKTQIRMQAQVKVNTGAQVEPAWKKVPDRARAQYAGAVPGTPLSKPQPKKNIGPFRFTILRAEITEFDILRLCSTMHQRAVFHASDGFRGTWVTP